MYGFSYQGLTQLLLDPRAPDKTGSIGGRNADAPAGASRGGADWDDPRDDPLPDCLAPACCGVDERIHWAVEGNAHWWGLGLGWALQLAAEGCRRRGDAVGWREIRASLETAGFLRDGLDLLARHDPAGMGLGWLRQDPRRSTLWRRHRLAPQLLRRPLLLIGAWHDPHLRGTLDLWRQARRAGGQPWLRIGAWSHLDWRGGLDRLQLAFFKAHLRCDGDTGVAAAPSPPHGAAALDHQRLEHQIALQAGEDGPWRAPTSAEPLAWRLRSAGLAAVRSDEGLLLPEADWGSEAPLPQSAPAVPKPPYPAQAGLSPEERCGRPPGAAAAEPWPLTLVHDPWRPVPGRGGHLGLEPGVISREDIDRRADVACFNSPPLTEPVRLQGIPQLVIAVRADQSGFDLCAALSVLATDGRAWQLSTGVARFLGDHCLGWRRRRLQLQPLLRELRPGERLRLSLAAAAWPQIGVNPGDGSPWAGAVGPAHRQITLAFDLTDARLWLTSMFGAN